MHKSVWYMLLMILAASGLGLTATLVDFLYQHGYSIEDLTNSQYGFAVLLVWLILLPSRKSQRLPKGTKSWILLIVTGVSGALAMVFYFQSLKYLSVSFSIVLLFQFTWIIMLIDIVVRRQFPSLEKWLGMAAILAGTVLSVGLLDAHATQLNLKGLFLGMAAALCFAISLYVPEFIDRSATPLWKAAFTLTVSAITLLPIYPPTYLTSGVLGQGLFGWGILIAIIGQLIPILFMMIAIPRIGGRLAGILGSAELPVTVVTAWWILDDHVTILRWLGVVMIILGILISELWKRP
ncbi:threonine/homoserine efflux transporter RhtA [Paenibacillus taihuensis]|uniref:Threonine/homoserine efflux transporter RhtA n=1 Tax=Paenibacillus taihuensis TaxID=1156355 RepID=A0A3D9S400_9BACL|nr:EamA family transporter [Paenibacillus taihuensis]REE87464.1 threonine/homoserine efflux transporter RhtA [Paenibacillus taihuensis]